MKKIAKAILVAAMAIIMILPLSACQSKKEKDPFYRPPEELSIVVRTNDGFEKIGTAADNIMSKRTLQNGVTLEMVTDADGRIYAPVVGNGIFVRETICVYSDYEKSYISIPYDVVLAEVSGAQMHGDVTSVTGFSMQTGDDVDVPVTLIRRAMDDPDVEAEIIGKEPPNKPEFP